MTDKNIERLYKMTFASVYPHYVTKVKNKGRSIEELHTVLSWLTGYDEKSLLKQVDSKTNFEKFFDDAPRIHPNASMITGVICGDRIENIKDDLVRKTRYMDKLVDELAKGKSIDKILRK